MRDVIEIETKRLRLRAIVMGDAPRVARFCNDPGVGRMLAQTPLPYLEAAAEGYILISRARAPGKHFSFAVDLPGEGIIGIIGAHARKDGGFEIGYWFGRPYWGCGFGSEAVGAFVAEARSLGELKAGHFVDNAASGNVLRKVGFAYTGETERMFSMGRGESVDCLRMRYAPQAANAFAEFSEALH